MSVTSVHVLHKGKPIWSAWHCLQATGAVPEETEWCL